MPLLLSARGPDDPAVRRAQEWLKSLRAGPPPIASSSN